MRNLIFANNYTRKPAVDATGAAFSFPKPIVAGQKWTIALRFTDRVEGAYTEYFPDLHSIKAAIGKTDLRPEGGTVKWQVGEGASTAGNTTAALDRAASAETVAAALNALTDFPDAGFDVEFDNGTYLVRQADGTHVEITMRMNKLRPITLADISGYTVDGEHITEVRYKQGALAFSDSAAPKLPRKPYIVTVADGATDASGVYKQNEVQNLIFPPDFRGGYYLRRGFNRTTLLSLDDGPEELQAALNAMLEVEDASVVVSNNETDRARIEFTGDLSGVDVEPLEVVVPDESAPPGDWTFTLALDKPEMRAALRTQAEITVPFELTARVYVNPEDHSEGTEEKILWNEDITIKRPLMWEGLATVQNIDWQRPPSPKSYLPFSPSTIITGQQHYVETFGDGDTTAFVFDHNLGTSDLAGIVILDTTAGRVCEPDEYDLTGTDSTASLTATFLAPPGPGGRKIVITSAGPTSRFIDGLEITRDQVNGLQDILDEYGLAIANLEAVLPSTGPGASANSTTGMIIKIPEKKEVLFYKGTDEPFDDKGVDVVKLTAFSKRPPYMLPAVHDSTAAVWADSTSADLVDIEASANNTFQNTSGASILVAGAGRVPSAYVEDDGFAACDGRILFAANRDGETNSYYPAAFERTLVTIPINDKQLRLGRKLKLEFGLELQVAQADCSVQWAIIADIGYPTAESSPDPVGLNLENIEWEETPIFRQRVDVTTLSMLHFFGVEISRGLAAIQLNQMLYGVWEGNDDAAPESANFMLRIRLAQFDTVNNRPLARGWVAYQLTKPAEGALQATIS